MIKRDVTFTMTERELAREFAALSAEKQVDVLVEVGRLLPRTDVGRVQLANELRAADGIVGDLIRDLAAALRQAGGANATGEPCTCTPRGEVHEWFCKSVLPTRLEGA